MLSKTGLQSEFRQNVYFIISNVIEYIDGQIKIPDPDVACELHEEAETILAVLEDSYKKKLIEPALSSVITALICANLEQEEAIVETLLDITKIQLSQPYDRALNRIVAETLQLTCANSVLDVVRHRQAINDTIAELLDRTHEADPSDAAAIADAFLASTGRSSLVHKIIQGRKTVWKMDRAERKAFAQCARAARSQPQP